MKFEIVWPIYVCQGCKKETPAHGVSFSLSEDHSAVVRETFGMPPGWFVQRVYVAGHGERVYREVALCTECLGVPHVRY